MVGDRVEEKSWIIQFLIKIFYFTFKEVFSVIITLWFVVLDFYNGSLVIF